jgi:hypothetical protein
MFHGAPWSSYCFKCSDGVWERAFIARITVAGETTTRSAPTGKAILKAYVKGLLALRLALQLPRDTWASIVDTKIHGKDYGRIHQSMTGNVCKETLSTSKLPSMSSGSTVGGSVHAMEFYPIYNEVDPDNS